MDVTSGGDPVQPGARVSFHPMPPFCYVCPFMLFAFPSCRASRSSLGAEMFLLRPPTAASSQRAGEQGGRGGAGSSHQRVTRVAPCSPSPEHSSGVVPNLCLVLCCPQAGLLALGPSVHGLSCPPALSVCPGVDLFVHFGVFRSGKACCTPATSRRS